MEITLFKWPPSPGIDAANPRGVAVNRILAYLKIVYTAKIINPVRADFDQEKLGNWISGFPVVSINGKAVNGIYRILNVLKENIPSAARLWDSEEAFEVSSWGFDHLYFLALYARMKREQNFKTYLESASKSQGDQETAKTISLLREIFLESLKWSSMGNLSEIEFDQVLNSSLKTLEKRISKNKFILTINNPTIADFAVFGPIQALLAPDLEERDLIVKKYPHLLNWAREMDKSSAGQWTRPLINL